MNHLRASALTADNSTEKKNARTEHEIAMPEQWRLYSR
jgi:hypothetical protein